MPRRMKMQLMGFELKRVHELVWTTEDLDKLPEPDKTKARLLLSAEKEAIKQGLPPASITKAILWISEEGNEFVEFNIPNPFYGTRYGSVGGVHGEGREPPPGPRKRIPGGGIPGAGDLGGLR